MKHRFTLEELRTWDDRKIIQTLIHERLSDLTNPYTLLDGRLRAISDGLGDCGFHFPNWEKGQIFGVLMTDFRKGKKHGHMPGLTPKTIVSCGGMDWRGSLEVADQDGRELRCPKCKNFIFMFADPGQGEAPDFTFRAIVKG